MLAIDIDTEFAFSGQVPTEESAPDMRSDLMVEVAFGAEMWAAGQKDRYLFSSFACDAWKHRKAQMSVTNCDLWPMELC
jgi:hypothetical protein